VVNIFLNSVHPISVQFDPPDEPDYFAGAILKSLARPYAAKMSWGLVKTVVLGVCTLGILPLLLLTRRLGAIVESDHAMADSARRWLQEQEVLPGRNVAGESAVGDTTTRSAWRLPWLVSAASRLGILALIGAIVAMISLGIDLPDAARIGLGHLEKWTYTPDDTMRQAHLAWTIFLSAGYFVHWLAVQRAVKSLRRDVTAINALVRQRNIKPISLPRLSGGRWIVWLVVGVVLASNGPGWAILMMLAAAAQRRYIRRTSLRTRQEMAGVLRWVVAHRTRRARVIVPQALCPRCPNAQCAARIRPMALYCPACGSAIDTQHDPSPRQAMSPSFA
jgi:hypothetical protein